MRRCCVYFVSKDQRWHVRQHQLKNFVDVLTEWLHPFVAWCACASFESTKSWPQWDLTHNQEYLEGW